MKARLLDRGGSDRLHVLVLDPGEEAFAAIEAFARKTGIAAASLSAIGAFERATVGWFDVAAKDYRRIAVGEQCEVLSALGDIAVDDEGRASLHLHAVLGLADGTTRGGHFLEGIVRPTLEVMVTETPVSLRRRRHKDLGVALLDLSPS
jgi:predicted DNA-binding protein with PD1-like motif